MQITIEFKDADQIAALAHIAEIVEFSREGDAGKIQSLYTRDVINSMAFLLEAFDNVLNYIDSPFALPEMPEEEAVFLVIRMRNIGERILKLRDEISHQEEA